MTAENRSQSELEAYQQRIAETDRVLGMSRTSLVQVSADARGIGTRLQLIYDEVSQQLHVLVPNEVLRDSSLDRWVWILDPEGNILAGSRMAPIGDDFSGTALDLSASFTRLARLVLTAAEQGTPESPTGVVLGDVSLDVSESK